MTPEADIITAVRQGNRAAYGELVERYQTMVRAVAIGILRDPDLADDAAQEAFVIAFEKLAKLRKRNSFAPWIARIAQREAHRLARHSSKMQPLSQRDEPEADAADCEALDLFSAVARLPKQERLAVCLKYFSGWPVQDIADRTGRSTGTVTKCLSRAYQRLRAWLEFDS